MARRLLRVLPRPPIAVLAALLLALSAPGPAAQATDGVIGADEYPNTLSRGDGSYLLAWRVQGRLIHLGISARTEGWVGLGIDPIVVLDNADFLYGWIDPSGVVQVRDARSLGSRGPIVEDVSRGGSNDILAYGGSRQEGRTVIELVRLLDTGDQQDAPIHPEGGNRILWAYGPDPSELSRLRQYGEAYLRPGEELRAANWWAALTETPLYSAGLTAAFLLLATSMLLGQLGRFRLGHRITGWIAVALAAALSQGVLLAPRGPLTLSALWGILAAGTGAAALIAAAVDARQAGAPASPGAAVGARLSARRGGSPGARGSRGSLRVCRILQWISLALLGGALGIALVRGGVF
ncbi:MAG: hypothetical protein JW820_18000 [Spirochaetales bacterium]|nr:hypothetical protein [Spirochaetales bacterium]